MPGVKGVATRVVSFRQRLRQGTLGPDELKLYERAKALYALRKQGYTQAQCAAELNLPVSSVGAFLTRGTYRTVVEHIEATTGEAANADNERQMRELRGRFILLGPKAMTALERSFEEAKPGEYKDDGKMMWATQMVARGLGLTEPPPPARPAIQINIGTLKAELADIRADDARARRAIDVTPQQEAP